MAYTIRQHVTPGRLRWLRELGEKGVAVRSGKGPHCYHCFRLGWTEWVRDANGKIIGERLTDAGRAALDTLPVPLEMAQRAIREAVAEEREACCALVYGWCESDNVAQRTVDAIRARGEKT